MWFLFEKSKRKRKEQKQLRIQNDEPNIQTCKAHTGILIMILFYKHEVSEDADI